MKKINELRTGQSVSLHRQAELLAQVSNISYIGYHPDEKRGDDRNINSCFTYLFSYLLKRSISLLCLTRRRYSRIPTELAKRRVDLSMKYEH